MSQVPRPQPDLENGNRRDGHPDQPPSAQNQQSQPSQGGSNFGDSSGPLFSLYSKIAEEEDNKMSDRWTKDADGILIFTGLFSASVAALLAVSIQDLIPNSQDTSAFYLEKIFEQLYLNITPTSIPSTIPKPPPFSPPGYAIWVNSLWFLSLVISLTAALLATSLQQWARRYVRLTQPPRCSPEKRARMRAFFADGMDKLHIPWAVEGLPALLHLSLFLFFSGALIFLFNINHTVFCWVIWCVVVSLMIYGWITVIPIFRHDSPYYAPLSGSAWLLYTGISYTFFKALAYIAVMDSFSYWTWMRFRELRDDYYRWVVGGVEKAAEETAWKQSSVIDLRILKWTLGTLGEDDLLEQFFDAIPGFFNSSLVKGLKRDYSSGLRGTLILALSKFLRRTLSSDSILDSVKTRRFIICIDAADLIDASRNVFDILFDVDPALRSLPLSIENGHALARWCTTEDPWAARRAQCIISVILIAVSQHDDRWIALAKDGFGIPEHVLRDNIAHRDDSVLLSIFIHVTRQTFDNPNAFYSSNNFFGMLLSTLSKFDIHRTVPELQHEFCALWNQIVLEARNHRRFSHISLLRNIRQTYVELHQGTQAASTHIFNPRLVGPSLYPLCTLASHRSDPTPEGSHPAYIETEPLPAITVVDALSISEANPVHTAAQQTEETIITHSPTDLAIIRSDDTTPHIHSSASPTAEPVHIHMPPQVTSPPGSSILIRDLNPPVQIPVSHKLPRSILLATDIDEPDNPTTDVHPPERRETSHAVSASPFTFPQPDPILPIVDPAPSVTLSCPQENNKQQDTCAATRSTTAHFEEISSTANPNSQHIRSCGATLPLHEDDEATVLCPIDSDSASLPIVIPTSGSDVVRTEHRSSVQSAPIRSDHTLRAPETLPSSSLATHSGVPSVSDAHVTTAIGAPNANDDLSAPTPMAAFPHLS